MKLNDRSSLLTSWSSTKYVWKMQVVRIACSRGTVAMRARSATLWTRVLFTH